MLSIAVRSLDPHYMGHLIAKTICLHRDIISQQVTGFSSVAIDHGGNNRTMLPPGCFPVKAKLAALNQPPPGTS